jgi:hypothetical protein
MPSPLEVVVGLAKQTGKGTEVTTAANFKYLPTENNSIGPANVIRALPLEQANLPMMRGVHRAGVSVAGTFSMIPRLESIGHILMGALGKDTVTGTAPGPYTHELTIDSANFLGVPWYTIRRKVSDLTGEIFVDCRIASVALRATATQYVRATVGVVGVTPKAGDSSSWDIAANTDTTDEFVTVNASVTSPSFGTLTITDMTITLINDIRVDPHFALGSPYPSDLPLRARTMTIDAIILANSGSVYKKLLYDPSGGNNWVSGVLEDAAFKLELKNTAGSRSLKFEFVNDGKAVWTAEPLTAASDDPVLAMRVTGMVKVGTGVPVKFTLVNDRQTAY